MLIISEVDLYTKRGFQELLRRECVLLREVSLYVHTHVLAAVITSSACKCICICTCTYMYVFITCRVWPMSPIVR